MNKQNAENKEYWIKKYLNHRPNRLIFLNLPIMLRRTALTIILMRVKLQESLLETGKWVMLAIVTLNLAPIFFKISCKALFGGCILPNSLDCSMGILISVR